MEEKITNNKKLSFPSFVDGSDYNKIKAETKGSLVGPKHPMFSAMYPSEHIPIARVNLTEPVFGSHGTIDRNPEDNQTLLVEKCKKTQGGLKR